MFYRNSGTYFILGGLFSAHGWAMPFVDDGFAEMSQPAVNEFSVPVTFAVNKPEELVEQELGEGVDSRQLIAACFSGGGSRSQSGVRGQLAVLDSLKASDGRSYLEKLHYISAVSGAAWGISAFFSAPDTLDKQVILGSARVRLEDLFVSDVTNSNENNLNWMHEQSLGRGPQRLGGLSSVGLQLFWETVSPFGDGGDKAWAKVINEKLLMPFGVPSYLPLQYSFRRSEGYGKEMIIVAAIRDDTGYLHLLEMTSKAVGVRAQKREVGGYMMSPEGFNRKIQSRQNGSITVRSGRKYTLAEALSASSANHAHFGNMLSSKLPDILGFGPAALKAILNWVVPDVSYPVLNEHSLEYAEKEFELVDAGPIDYLGLTPLLARGVRKIVAFVNTDIPITARDHSNGTVIGIEKAIPAFFGVCPDQKVQRDGYVSLKDKSCTRYPLLRNNQVFETDAYEELAGGLLRAKRAGRSVVYEQQHLQVLPNSHYAVEGGYDVDILWVYNDLPDGWLKLLPEDVRLLVEGSGNVGQENYGSPSLAGFPHNSAMFELGLSEAKANLLTVFAVDMMQKSAPQLERFFTTPGF